MTELQIFRTGEFELPLIPDGDSFRVNATMVAGQLGYRNAPDMVRALADDEKTLVVGDAKPQVKGYASLRTPSDQGVWYLTEPGFYKVVGQRNINLIKNPDVRAAAHRFQRWVFHEVIPAMVRTGHTVDLNPGTTWSWDDVAAEIRQRYGLDYKPAQVTAGLRSAGWLKAGSCVPKHVHRFKFWHTGTAYHLLPHALPELVADLLDTLREIGDVQAQQFQLTIFPAPRGTTALA